MVVKTVVLLVWFAVSYALLVFAATEVWQGIAASCSLALAIAGIGFGIQHDANHGSYSKSGAVNRVLGLTLDLMGASSYVWRWKHNVFHHTYTNLSDADIDIDLRPFGRLAPGQRRRSIHRFQQFYLWALYGFLGPKWHFVDDFKNVAEARIGGHRFPRPRGWSLLELVASKALFFGWAFVVPLLLHGFWITLAFYALTWFIVGVVLSVVFQLAHCVEEAEFPQPDAGGERIAGGWAMHQVHTTVDFAQGGSLLTWYLGGLNFQIEHHLLPKICHVHYPALSPIVQQACADFGVRYVTQERFLGAVASHWRWLRRMGRPAAAAGMVGRRPGLAA
jgi:linoleoyl-CoA desaturase